MPRMIFDNCCSCIELKRGCFVIGYLELAMELALSGRILKRMLNSAWGSTDQTRQDQPETSGLILDAIYLLVFLALLGFTICLLVGLSKDKRGYVKAYLISAPVFIVIMAILVSFYFSLHPKYIDKVIPTAFLLVLVIYFQLVVRSYYYKTDDYKTDNYKTDDADKGEINTAQT